MRLTAAPRFAIVLGSRLKPCTPRHKPSCSRLWEQTLRKALPSHVSQRDSPHSTAIACGFNDQEPSHLGQPYVVKTGNKQRRSALRRLVMRCDATPRLAFVRRSRLNRPHFKPLQVHEPSRGVWVKRCASRRPAPHRGSTLRIALLRTAIAVGPRSRPSPHPIAEGHPSPVG